MMQALQIAAAFLGVLVAALGAGFGLFQYRMNQTWRETEFIATQAKMFYENQNIRTALKILDWEKRKIELTPGIPTVVTREMLRSALGRGRNAASASADDASPSGVSFSTNEAILRDIFDDFFSALERFEQFINAEVIVFRQVRPYFQYWARVLNGKRLHILDQQTVDCIWAFMSKFEYNDAMALLKRYQIADDRADPSCSSNSSPG
jgi:hypothetical protein